MMVVMTVIVITWWGIKWRKKKYTRNSLKILFILQLPPLLPPQQPQKARASSILRLHAHTQTQHTQQGSSGRVISPTQRPLPDNTQHLPQTDIHASGGIRTRNPSKRAAPNALDRADAGIGSILHLLLLLPVENTTSDSTSIQVLHVAGTRNY